MNTETAAKINGAACWVYFVMERLTDRCALAHFRTIADCTLAQMQTATDVIRALNASDPHTIHCFCDERVLPRVKAFADDRCARIVGDTEGL